MSILEEETLLGGMLLCTNGEENITQKKENFCMIELYYLLATTTLVLVPIFRVSGTWEYGYSEAKNQLLILLMGIASILLLYTGFPHGGPSIWLLLFVTYLTLSCVWSDLPENALADVPRWWAIFILYSICRLFPQELILYAVFLPAPAVGVYACIQKIFKFDPLDKFYNSLLKQEDFHERERFDSWIGNPNYLGAYLIVPFFVGLHLAVTTSYWFLLPNALVLVCIGLTHSRAAQLGCVIGFSYLLPLIALPCAVLLFLIVVMSPWRSGLRAAWDGRKHYYYIGWFLFKKHPIFGHGPRVFRRKVFRAQAELRPKKYEMGKRMHQEHLETLIEGGLIGFGLWCIFFYSILRGALHEPLLFGALVAVLINAFFFYPFRSAASGLSFWALAGTLSGSFKTLSLPLPALALISILILWLTYYHSIRKFVANYWYFRSQVTKGQEAITNINHALVKYPRCNAFLVYAGELFLPINPQVSSAYFQRGLEHNDGEKVEWTWWVRYGEILCQAGDLAKALAAFQTAVHLNPNFPLAAQRVKSLEEIMKKQPKVVYKVEKDGKATKVD